MKKASAYPLAFCLGLWLVLNSLPGFLAAEKPESLVHPERLGAAAEIQGQILQMDSTAGQLTLKDNANQSVTVKLDSDTRATDRENHVIKWTALRPGDRVILYYNTRERRALQVDLLPTVHEHILGTGVSAVERGF